MMSFVGRVLDTLLTPGRRKAVQTLGGILFLSGYALYMKAPFSEYRDGLIILVGAALGLHTLQELKGKEPVKP